MDMIDIVCQCLSLSAESFVNYQPKCFENLPIISFLCRAFVRKQVITQLKTWGGALRCWKRNTVHPVSNLSNDAATANVGEATASYSNSIA